MRRTFVVPVLLSSLCTGACAANVTSSQEASPDEHIAVGRTSEALSSAQNNVMIRNRNSSMCVTVQGASTTPGANIVQMPCDFSADSLWNIVPSSTAGYSTITSVMDGMCLDVWQGSTADEVRLDTWPCKAPGGNANQLWAITQDGNGTHFQSLNSGKYIDVVSSSTTSGAQVQQYDGDGAPAQNFDVIAASYAQNNVVVVNTNSGKCLNITGANSNPGTPLIQWTCDYGSNSRWNIVPAAFPGYYNIVSTMDGLCVDVFGGGNAAETILDTWPCNGGGNQAFFITEDVNGTHFQVMSSGQVMDVRSASLDNLAPFQQYPSNGGLAQNFAIVAAGSNYAQQAGSSAQVFTAPQAPYQDPARGPEDSNSPNDRSCVTGTYVVPAGVSAVKIAATGGSGQSGFSGSAFALIPHIPSSLANALTASPGNYGLGAIVDATIPVTPGATLYVMAASNAGFGGPSYGWGFPGAGTGYNPGGGASYVSTVAPTKPEYATCFVPPESLLIVAGGGGGGGDTGDFPGYYGGSGGNAGLLWTSAASGGSGGGSLSGGGGGGGSQIGGGGVGSHPGCGSEGRWGGAYLRGSDNDGYGGSGGGGFYGGGAGGGGDCFLDTGAGGGGGGSSWVVSTASMPQSGWDGTASPGVVITPMVATP